MKKIYNLFSMQIWSLVLTICGVFTFIDGQILLDNFNRTNNDKLYFGWYESEPTLAHIQVNANRIRMRPLSTTGRLWAYQNVSASYITKGIALNTSTIEWGFNMRIQHSNPGGFDSGNYGIAFVLGSTSSDITLGEGYAVVLGQPGSNDYLRLVKFSGGMDANSNLTDVITGTTDYGAEYLSVRVTFNPALALWTLYADSSTSLPFPTDDPTTVTTLVGSNVDVTYITSSYDLKYMGAYYNHDNGTNIAFFDSIYFPSVCSSVTFWNGSSWSATPSSTRYAIVDGNFDTSVDGTLNVCAMYQKGGSFSIADGDYVSVANSFVSEGTIQISTEGSLVQSNPDALSPTISLVKQVGGRNFNDVSYWSSPVENAPIGLLLSSNQYYLRKYISVDGSAGGWKNPTLDLSETQMEVGRGYSARENQGSPNNPSPPYTTTINFNGKANNGTISKTLGMGTANRAFQYLGNPYPSAISADTFFSENPNLDQQAFIWYMTGYAGDLGNANYSTSGDYISYVPGSGSTPPFYFDGYFASAQGFVVKRGSATSAVFNNTQRETGYNYQFYSSIDRFWLQLKFNGTQNHNSILIAYPAGSTTGYENGFDGILFTTQQRRIFTLINGSSDQYSIQGRGLFNPADVVQMGYSTSTTPNAPLSIHLQLTEGIFSDPNQKIYLHDKYLNVYHDLKLGPYTFSESNTIVTDRFEITYHDGSLGNDELEGNLNDVWVAIYGGNLYAKSKEQKIKAIHVYDTLGRLVQTYPVNAIDFNTQFAHPKGIFFANYELENGEIRNAKLINN